MEDSEKLERKIAQYPYLKFNREGLGDFKPKNVVPSVLDSGIVFSTINARSAIEIGLRCLKPQKGDEILLPAYQCPVAIHAVVRAGMSPVFYEIYEDCTINYANLKSKVSSKTKAILAVHYFGFPTPTDEIRELCTDLNIYFVEDCALTFFGENNGRPIGAKADFSIASLYKFFPAYHGGFLIFQNKKLAEQMEKQSTPLLFQLKSALNTLEMGCESDNSLRFRKAIFAAKDRILRCFKPSNSKGNIATSQGTKQNPFSPEVIDKTYSDQKMPLFSKMIYSITNKEKVMVKRQHNFQFLSNALKDKPGLQPLKRKLPATVVPYNFPILSEKADKLAKFLRDRNVKIARFAEYLWKGINKADYPVTCFYAKNCIQLPIHQSLTIKDMEHIINIIDDF
ncbi:MAG: DegT/DnrJ/EryC1/StrS family aminotransferase [Desulfobacula sp.]|nr:DegT/DnrJ/EryC1/StrS family aminotransferase [Desulfobacula sp.]